MPGRLRRRRELLRRRWGRTEGAIMSGADARIATAASCERPERSGRYMRPIFPAAWRKSAAASAEN